jgi:hypothetical protein
LLHAKAASRNCFNFANLFGASLPVICHYDGAPKVPDSWTEETFIVSDVIDSFFTSGFSHADFVGCSDKIKSDVLFSFMVSDS